MNSRLDQLTALYKDNIARLECALHDQEGVNQKLSERICRLETKVEDQCVQHAALAGHHTTLVRQHNELQESMHKICIRQLLKEFRKGFVRTNHIAVQGQMEDFRQAWNSFVDSHPHGHDGFSWDVLNATRFGDGTLQEAGNRAAHSDIGRREMAAAVIAANRPELRVMFHHLHPDYQL